MLINASAGGLVVSERDLNFFDVLGHELSPYPVAMSHLPAVKTAGRCEITQSVTCKVGHRC